MRTVISLCGRKRTGKESAYKVILPYVDRPQEFQFATPLKKFCIEVLGLTHDQCYGSSEHRESLTKYVWGDLASHIQEKWEKNPADIMTARDVLQVVGTDLMRQGFNTDVWAEGGIREALRSSANTCCFTDSRFPNEVRISREAQKMDASFGNSILIRLYRETGLTDSHNSETALDCYDLFPCQRALNITLDEENQLLDMGYQRINPTLFKSIRSDTIYDYLIDNNGSLQQLRKNMIFILKEKGIYQEPSCS